MSWYHRARRDLPWRNTSDPYAIWVSEIMLQQTQVATVVDYYHRFLARFPDVTRLAAADAESVLAAWAGLGYYRRARALHEGARLVRDRHRGRVPDRMDALLALPGVGRYTAGAIASIAFGQPEPVLDGNVRRVLARLFAVNGDSIGRAEEQRRLWSLAAQMARSTDPGSTNQALMELGALRCTSQQPACDRCPVSSDCEALRLGLVSRLPAGRPRPPVQRVRVAVGWIARAGRILLQRRSLDGPLRGTWDVPAVVMDTGADTGKALIRAMRRRHQLELRVGEPLARVRHAIMNRRLDLVVIDARLIRGRVTSNDRLRWVAPGQIDDVAVSGATRKVIASRRGDARDARGNATGRFRRSGQPRP